MVCAAVEAAAPDALRRISDQLYEVLLLDVQDYLRDNVDFNLSSELARAKRSEAEARDALYKIAEALGAHRSGWPCGPSVAETTQDALKRIEALTLAESATNQEKSQ